jgi:hypothetical protein
MVLSEAVWGHRCRMRDRYKGHRLLLQSIRNRPHGGEVSLAEGANLALITGKTWYFRP